MISNLSETLKKAYDDALITGKVEGVEEGIAKGKEQAKSEINGCSKNKNPC